MATKVIESLGDTTELGRSGVILVNKLDNAVAALDAKQAEFAEYLKELKEREQEVQDLKDALYLKMVEEGVKKLENDHLIVSAITPKPRHTIDIKEVQATNPGLYAQLDEAYGKDTPVKGYAKIKVKES